MGLDFPVWLSPAYLTILLPPCHWQASRTCLLPSLYFPHCPLQASTCFSVLFHVHWAPFSTPTKHPICLAKFYPPCRSQPPRPPRDICSLQILQYPLPHSVHLQTFNCLFVFIFLNVCFLPKSVSLLKIITMIVQLLQVSPVLVTGPGTEMLNKYELSDWLTTVQTLNL